MNTVPEEWGHVSRPRSPHRLSSFVYEDLIHKRSIRLFQITPGLPIRLTLQQFDLNKNPTYQAFSYTWGDADDVEMIHVNGEQFEVRWNLYAFLEQLCLQGDTSTFWCDAICINQEDTLERNHQVGFMGHIYRNAQKVLVWLGEDQIFTDDVLSIGQEAGSWPKAKKIHCPKLPLCEYHFFYYHLDYLLSVEYWYRTWIVQEFLLAQEIEILCGTSRAPLVVYQNLISLACSRLKAVDGLEDRCQNPRDCSTSAVSDYDPGYAYGYRERDVEALQRLLLDSLMFKLIDDRVSRPIRKAYGARKLEDLIDSYQQTRCKDPRDKVFAFLGLANDVDMIEVDYTKDPVDLWEDLEDIYGFNGSSMFGQNLLIALGITRVRMGMLRDYPDDIASNPVWREDMLDRGIGWLTGSKRASFLRLLYPLIRKFRELTVVRN